MPRRKPVHPQPSKREEERQLGEAEATRSSATGSSISRTPAVLADEGLVKMASRPNDTTFPAAASAGRKPLLRQTRAVSRMKSVADPQDGASTKDELKKEDEVPKPASPTGGAGGDGVQRNLSLEALFQVTHSELKNISRTEDDPTSSADINANGDMASGDASAAGTDAHADEVTEVAPPGGAPQVEVTTSVTSLTSIPSVTVGGGTGGGDEGAVNDVIKPESNQASSTLEEDPSRVAAVQGNTLQICVEVPTTPPEAAVEVEMSDASPEAKQAMVKLPVSEKGIEKYQLKSDSLEEQGLKLTYTKKTYDQYEPNPISYGTYKPRSYKPSSQVVDPALQESGGTAQVGRKRKYPAKPGRHICPYCGRGCAKPSVLQKHIRAHTGERPYPCVPCGFSFKTKSNLYKHCKSRAHAIKAGQTPSVDDPAARDANRSRDESIGDEDMDSDEVSEGEEGRMSDSSARDGSSRSASLETGDATPGSSFDSMRSRSRDEQQQQQQQPQHQLVLQLSETGEVLVASGSGGAQAALKTDIGNLQLFSSQRSSSPQLVRATEGLRSEKQYLDVASLSPAEAAVKLIPHSHANVIELPAGTVTAKSTSKVTTSQVASPLTVPTSDLLNVTTMVQKESDNSMKVTIRYPKVTKQRAVSLQGDQTLKVSRLSPVTSSANFRRSASLPEHAQVKLPAVAASGKTKAHTADVIRDRPPQLQPMKSSGSVDHKNMTPEMVGERISQLISDNAALLDMPMADAPRPKRMSRQNSEVKPEPNSGSQRGILSSSLSLDSGANRPLYQSQSRAKSVELKVMEVGSKNVNFLAGHTNQVHFLSQAEPTDQPPGADSDSQKMAELMAAAKNATTIAPTSVVTAAPSTPLPQEIKIQFQLPKAASTDLASLSSVAAASSAPSVVLPASSQSYIAQPSVLLPGQGAMLTRQLSLPIAPQQVTDSSVIRELLLKGQGEAAAALSDAAHTSGAVSQKPGQQQQQQHQQQQQQATTMSPMVQMVELMPGSTPVVVLDSKGTPTTTYMAPVTQDPVPMNVAQDVEVVATTDGVQNASDGSTSPRTQLKRAISLPEGIPMASGSMSPYGSVIFEHYDPKVPPKRGRPKGSKNRVREQLSLNLPASSVTATVSSSSSSSSSFGGSSPALLTSTMRSSSQSLAGTPKVTAQTRPSLRLTIPPPPTVSSFATLVETPSLGSSLGSSLGHSLPSSLPPQVDTPTTQSLLKLKLKGKLLMKRSMSQERVLSQERERQGLSVDESLPNTPVQVISSPALHSRSGSTLTPTAYVTNPLQRAASADEATPLKKLRASFQSRSMDSPIRRLLGHHSSSDSSLQSFSISTEAPYLEPPATLANAVPGAASILPSSLSFESLDEKKTGSLLNLPSLTRQDSLSLPLARVPSKLSPLAVVVSTTPTIVVSRGTAPTNQSQLFTVQTLPFMAPLLQLNRQEKMQLPQSLYLSLRLSPNASNLVIARSPSEDVDVTKSAATTPDTPSILVKKSSLEKTDSKALGGEAVISAIDSVGSSSQDGSLTKGSSLVREQSGSLEKEDSGTGESPASGRPLSDVGLMRVLLLGHQCPMLRMMTHTTFCTLAKPQPMYVPQETCQRLSMYSNWRSARYNPNPVGLSSRELMALYHLRRHQVDPFFTSPTMGPSKTGVLTHSSYWNYYNKMRALQPGEEDRGEEEVRTIKQVPEVKMATVVRVAEEQQEKLLHLSAPNVAMETVVVTTPPTTSSAAAVKQKAKEPKRLKIFAGGYKTNEEYIYIRGRGRGKYVCEECGIRCKKPSMLRKHIRTHTDVRPYMCQHCAFSFKTKGNLTKHMKSKAHQKKCVELGVVPVPVVVDDSQIDAVALALQARMAKEGRSPSEEDDGTGHQSEDEDEEEEEEEVEEEEEEDGVLESQEMMVLDATTGEVRQAIRYHVVGRDSEGPHYVAIQEGDRSQPTLVKIDAKTQAVLVQHVKSNGSQQDSIDDGGSRPANDDQDNSRPRPSIDKEIAHSLLDLSKSNEPVKSKGAISVETRRLLRQHSAHAAEEKEKREERIKEGAKETSVDDGKDKDDLDGKGDGTRLDSLIGALISRTKGPGEGSSGRVKTESTLEAGHLRAPLSMVRMATTIYSSASLPTSRTQPSTSDLQHIHRRTHNTYAQKIAALQSANENDLRLTLGRSRVNTTGSGFVPPILLDEKTRQASSPASAVKESGTTATTTTTKNQLRRQASVGGLSESAATSQAKSTLPSQVTSTCSAAIPAPESEPSVPTSMIRVAETAKEGLSLGIAAAAATPAVVTSPSPGISAQSTSEEDGTCPLDMTPTSKRPADAPIMLKDGKYMCPFCDKVFAEFAQYAYHKNIHYIERSHRCEDCSLAFRTRAHLKKHQRSEVHLAKQSVNKQFGTPTSDNPRPFKCEDCKIAFRIHGHLAKHLRSKSHITTLERLGKTVPENTAGSDSDVEVIEDEDSMSMETSQDDTGSPQVSSMAMAAGSAINIALNDPNNLLQPRESTPTPPPAPSVLQDGSAEQAETTQLTQLSVVTPSTQSSQQSSVVMITTASVQKEAVAATPEADEFLYHKHSDYEKDLSASNEKVTVEKIKMEPIDMGTFSSLGTRTEGDNERYVATENDSAERVARNREVFRHQAGSGSGEQHPHKCGICGRTFRAISTLKQHLVTHAELRPYVCEYCDAGFTTAQSLKFHLRTHTQERPYICGQCGKTFARSDHLRQHMHEHEEDSEESSFQPTKPASLSPKPAAAAAAVSVEAVSTSNKEVVTQQTATTPPVRAKAHLRMTPSGSPQSLRPAGGQLYRSISADQHLMREIQPKAPETQVLMASPVGSIIGEGAVGSAGGGRDAAARRLAFTSSLSLPLQSGAVQLVPMVASGSAADHVQLIPQPLNVVRMPLLSLPVQQQSFGGSLQSVISPSTSVSSVQTLLLQSPMMLPSMSVLQQLATPTQANNAPIMATPTITITPPAQVQAKQEEHYDLPTQTKPLGVPEQPVLIPTVVLEQEDEASANHGSPVIGDHQHQMMDSLDHQDVSDTPKLFSDEQAISASNSLEQVEKVVPATLSPEALAAVAPVITVTPPDGKTVTEHMPITPADSLGYSQARALIDETPPVTAPSSIVDSGVSGGIDTAVTTHQDTKGSGLVTKLIPGNDKAQEDLLRALEQQGLSLDKVRVLQVKGDSEDSTQYVIIEADSTDKVDDAAIAELLSQNQARQSSTLAPGPASGVTVSTYNLDTTLNPAEHGHQDALPATSQQGQGAGEVHVELDSIDPMKESSAIASSRQRGILKRQHSIDLADHTGANSRQKEEQAASEQASAEPASKVRVVENSLAQCIPQPVVVLDAKQS